MTYGPDHGYGGYDEPARRRPAGGYPPQGQPGYGDPQGGNGYGGNGYGGQGYGQGPGGYGQQPQGPYQGQPGYGGGYGDGYGQPPYSPPPQGYPQQPYVQQYDQYGYPVSGYGYDGYDGYEEEDSGRSSKQSKKALKKKKKRRKMLIWTLVLVIIFGGGTYGAMNTIFASTDYEGTGTSEEVQIEVKPGAGGMEIARTLAKAGVIKTEGAFVAASSANEKSKSIQAGFYKLHKEMSAAAAIVALLDPKNRVIKTLLITEGMITFQIYDKMVKDLGLNLDDIKKAAEDPVKLGVPEEWFVRTDGRKVFKTIEGFLFPATYEFAPNVTAEQALKTMVAKFLDVAKEIKFIDNAKAIKDYKISPFEALVTASILQAEFVIPGDMPKGARVVYRRAYGNFPCKCLGLDSAINYYLHLTGAEPKDSKKITVQEMQDKNNPYNTYVVAGVPPGPIGNPGKVAMQAALNPTAGTWLYWVAVDAKGTTLFASTNAEHCKNIKVAIQNGVLNEGC